MLDFFAITEASLICFCQIGVIAEAKRRNQFLGRTDEKF
jgi:hypothetical protein